MTDKHDDDTPENSETDALEEAAETAAQEAGGDDRVSQLEAENAELRDRALRALAELENTRKRAERDVASARAYAIERFAIDLIGVADNLQRALANAPDETKQELPESVKNLISGVEMTERELMRVFERHGIAKEEPQGETFDPNKHQAVAQIPSELPNGKVAEVMQTGYVLGDRTLRAAMVAVSSGGQSGGGNGGNGAKGPASADAEAPAGGTTDFKV